MTAPGYWVQVDVDTGVEQVNPRTGAKSTYQNVYTGTDIPDAMAAWSKAISDGAEYVMLEALRQKPREGEGE